MGWTVCVSRVDSLAISLDGVAREDLWCLLGALRQSTLEARVFSRKEATSDARRISLRAKEDVVDTFEESVETALDLHRTW